SSALANIWQRAEDARDTIVIGNSSGLPWPRADVARIVAIPLFVSRKSVGTLLAGLRPESAVHGGVERLELRADLAAAALAQRQQTAALSLERKRQLAFLDNDSAAKIVIENGGRIGALSRGAQELLGQAISETSLARQIDTSQTQKFAGLFHAEDRSKI